MGSLGIVLNGFINNPIIEKIAINKPVIEEVVINGIQLSIKTFVDFKVHTSIDYDGNDVILVTIKCNPNLFLHSINVGDRVDMIILLKNRTIKINPVFEEKNINL